MEGAEHIWVEGGTHLCFWVSDEVYEAQRKAFEFIRGHLRSLVIPKGDFSWISHNWVHR